MIRTPLGEIAQEFWLKIHDLHPHVIIDEFIIMPNHIHGILIMNAPGDGGGIVDASQVETLPVETLQCNVSTKAGKTNAAAPQNDLSKHMSAISPKRGSISAIIRSYKTAVTRWARGNGIYDFAWQARYYDHIIRNERALEVLRQYIINNPLKWELDRENPDFTGAPKK